MKTKIAASILIICACAVTALANDNTCYPSAGVQESFRKEYPGAWFSKWESLENENRYGEKENIYAVRFVHNNESLIAYYGEDGRGIGFAKLVHTNALPAKVKKSIGDLFRSDEILNLQEVAIQGRHLFYFNIERGNDKFFITMNSNGKIKGKRMGMREK